MVKFFAILAIATCAARADLLVVPNANAGANGNSGTIIPLSEGATDILFQWDLAGSQFSSVPVGSSITGIGFRLEAGQATAPAADVTVGTFDLQLSTSLNPIGGLSATQSNNIGSDAVTVLSGPLTIPADSLVGGAGPNPFFLIDFTTPYTYQGGDLLFSLHVANAAATGSFILDADMVDANGDTVANLSGAAKQTEFFNYPVTEIQFSGAASTPEPSSLLMLGSGMILLAGCGLRAARRGR
jgi:PEP-CTERM motif-containing protein